MEANKTELETNSTTPYHISSHKSEKKPKCKLSKHYILNPYFQKENHELNIDEDKHGINFN